MRIFLCLLLMFLLVGNVSAECRQKECMSAFYEFQSDSSEFTFFYDEVFNIGTNWYVIFDFNSSESDIAIDFEFNNQIAKERTLTSSSGTDSVSFSGASFSQEKFNVPLHINISYSGTEIHNLQVLVQINKPPADDLFYLWGGMTVFWASIGAYVVYISLKYKKLEGGID